MPVKEETTQGIMDRIMVRQKREIAIKVWRNVWLRARRELNEEYFYICEVMGKIERFDTLDKLYEMIFKDEEEALTKRFWNKWKPDDESVEKFKERGVSEKDYVLTILSDKSGITRDNIWDDLYKGFKWGTPRKVLWEILLMEMEDEINAREKERFLKKSLKDYQDEVIQKCKGLDIDFILTVCEQKEIFELFLNNYNTEKKNKQEVRVARRYILISEIISDPDLIRNDEILGQVLLWTDPTSVWGNKIEDIAVEIRSELIENREIYNELIIAFFKEYAKEIKSEFKTATSIKNNFDHFIQEELDAREEKRFNDIIEEEILNTRIENILNESLE